MDAGGIGVSGEGVLPAPPAVPRANGNESFYDAAVNGQPVRVVELRMPAPRAGAPHGAIVRVAETLNRRNALAREILLSVILPQALLLAVAGIVVWVGVAHGLAPLERLRRRVAARSHREWSPVAEDDVPGEVRPLLQAIDELVARLDNALTLQSRFISDAAHQLKTPVAALKANVELAMRESDAQRAAQALAAANAGLDRVSRLISQLLSLARNEPDAAASIAIAPVDLGALVLERAATDWVPAALKRASTSASRRRAVPVTVQGDRRACASSRQTSSTTRCVHAGGRARTVRVDANPPSVQVDDDGPRIPPEERQRVFERFHRLLGDAHGGSGLGLAIAREIARIHGAAITLRDDDDGTGNTFKVAFPAP